MGAFSKFIALLTLAATASVFYVTVTRMNPHLTSIFSETPPQSTATVLDTTLPHSPRSNPSEVTSAPLPENVVPSPAEKESVSIPDAVLTGDIHGEAEVNSVEASYTYSFEKLASAIHTRTNLARSQNNLPTLAFDDTLTAMARARSEDMTAHSYFSHTTPDGCDLNCRFKASHYPSLTLGENIAQFSDYTMLREDELAQSFVDDWIQSSTHRKNLLSQTFTNEGIGVAIKNKRLVVTVLFAKP